MEPQIISNHPLPFFLSSHSYSLFSSSFPPFADHPQIKIHTIYSSEETQRVRQEDLLRDLRRLRPPPLLSGRRVTQMVGHGIMWTGDRGEGGGGRERWRGRKRREGGKRERREG